MDKKQIGFLIFIIILILVGYYFSQQNNHKQIQDNQNQQKEEITKNNIKENMEEENKKTNGEIITTESGLQYEVITMGDGPKPKATDTVEVHYEGKLENGEIFDSSYARGEKISFPLNQVIAGWTEGLQLMPVGSKFKFIIPAELAYGPAGSGHPLSGKTLIFTVELFDIK